MHDSVPTLSMMFHAFLGTLSLFCRFGDGADEMLISLSLAFGVEGLNFMLPMPLGENLTNT